MTIYQRGHEAATATTAEGDRRWRILGGGTLLVAALLLLLASILEANPITHPADHDAGFWLFAIVYSLSSILFLLAVFPLAFGSSGSNGIVSDSALGKTGLIAFGVFCLVSRELYLVGTYFTNRTATDTASNLSNLASLLLFVGAIIAGIVIARRGVAQGIARWSMLIALAISLITTALTFTTDATATIRVLDCISALGQAFAGYTYLTAKTTRTRR